MSRDAVAATPTFAIDLVTREIQGIICLAVSGTAGRLRQAFDKKGLDMYAGVGMYFCITAKELFDILEEHKTEVEIVIRQVKGFVRYRLAHSGDGEFSVTVCQDKAGTNESAQVAREWLAKNSGNTGAGAPKVS